MAHKHADGAEEFRERTPQEIAALEEQNRIAGRSVLEDRRTRNLGGPISLGLADSIPTHASISKDRRKS